MKYDPTSPEKYPFDVVYRKLESLYGKRWEHNLGDGKASERLVGDLVERMTRNDGFRLHKPEEYHLDIARSYREDGL